ncbi:MAG TPA: RMD1 family protein [Gammaproteobacteria bacterium]|nr:RMD1 family protein [Gammaproteobacteria bacterium]
MRCISYCTAKNYQLNEMVAYFKSRQYQTRFYRDVLHLCKNGQPGDIFCFPQGCMVVWALTRKQELQLMAEIQKFSIALLDRVEMDSFSFRLGERTRIYVHERFNIDIIELESNSVAIKLAISYGLAQSIKLAAYEEAIQKMIKQNEKIPEELAKRGRIRLSHRAISKRMGEIFLERSDVNLSSEYLEMPEYFWQFPNLETNYVMTEKYLDVPRRAHALNRKLDVLHEIIDMLNTQLHHLHSSMLETIIILLILMEIFISLFQIHFF